MPVHINIKREIFLVCLTLCSISVTPAQDRVLPAISATQVGVSTLRHVDMAPEATYVGTVSYPEVSEVASESKGRIARIHFEEGQRLRRGDLLVNLDTDVLEKTLQGTIASYEEALTHLAKAKADLSKIRILYEKKVVSEQLYEEREFKVQSLEKKARSLLAETERLSLELQKKAIRAPFDGIVVKRWVDTGEWLQPGSVVATLARNDVVDVIVKIPEAILGSIRLGMDVKVKALGKETIGKITAIVPHTDISTRTLPVKVRISNTISLVEGMGATVSLPSTERRKVFMIPRSAVIHDSGTPVIFAVVDSKVRRIPVKVIAFQGNQVGIEAEGLSDGMSIVVKGNERMKDGQTVTVLGGPP